MQPLKLTVIIPTYNRAELLGETLATLVEQDFDKSQYEVLVVDNASTDATRQVVEQWEKKTNGLIRYLYELRPGSHYARNGAVKHAKGEILYFTDDDVLAQPDMLTEILKPFEDKTVVTVTGAVRPKWLVEPPQWVKKYLSNYLLSLNEMEQKWIVSDDDQGIFSCHQAVRKDWFVRAGGYNPDIVNGEWVGDNETGLNIKLKNLGGRFAYNGAAIIYHQIPASRMTQEYLNRRKGNQGYSDAYTEYRKHHYTNEELKSQNKMFWRKAISRLFKAYKLRFLKHSDAWHLKRAEYEYFLNRIHYNEKLLNDPKWREMVLQDNWI